MILEFEIEKYYLKVIREEPFEFENLEVTGEQMNEMKYHEIIIE